LLLGNTMFEMNAKDISDVVYVNPTYKERTEHDTSPSNLELISDRVRTDVKDVIIMHAESVGHSGSAQTEHDEDNDLSGRRQLYVHAVKSRLQRLA